MALGPRQRETLDEYAGIWKRSPEIIRLEVFIDAYRAYTRELGSGRAILLRAFECYEEGEYKLTGCWIANCHQAARHLRATTAPAGRFIRSGIGSPIRASRISG